MLARHTILTRFFAEILQLPAEAAEEQACAMEHSLSNDAMDRLVRLFEFLHVCPMSPRPEKERQHDMRTTVPLLLASLGGLALAGLAWGQQPPPGPAPPAGPTTPFAADPSAPEAHWQAERSELTSRLDRLERQLADLVAGREEEELERLRQAAEAEAAAAPGEAPTLEERTYITAARSLQALNPEISVAGDFVSQLVVDEGFYASEDDRSGLPLRALDMHVQSTLDPFSLTKMAFGFDPTGGVSVEELYITWTGVIPRATLTVGRFRHLFGVLNRWHEHDLDQVGYPLALDGLLGEGGLTQTGLSFGWLMPALWAHTNELTLEVTNGSSEQLFAGEYFSVPTGLLHLKSYYDLTEDAYLELGLSGLFGFNNARGRTDPAAGGRLVDEDWQTTWVGGADLTVAWEPLQQARYRSLTWRSEGYWVRKETAPGLLTGWGAYSYLTYQLDASWFLGVRGDVLSALAEGDAPRCWQVVPYATVWQSEFVYLRVEGRYGDVPAGGGDTRRDARVLLQVNWAAGPHKHEKY